MNGWMNGWKTLRHLIWKDWRTARPLAVALIAFSIAMNGVAAILPEANLEVAFAIWILTPNLAALAAPAMLVGTEGDAKTLDWLRTLPPSWRRIADAKLLVAVGLVGGVWVVASGMLWLQWISHPPNVSPSPRSPQAETAGVLGSLYFSGLLLLCSFVTAYAFRSPVSGILAVVPLITAAAVASFVVADAVMRSLPSDQGVVVNCLLAVAALATAASLQRWAAWYRLQSAMVPIRDWISNAIVGGSSPSTAKSLSTARAYRPPRPTTAWRPSASVGLVWQHARQTGWAGIAILLLGFAVCGLDRITDFGAPGKTLWKQLLVTAGPYGVAPLLSMWLGCLAFSGDLHPGRREFLACHGVTPTAVWRTRLVVPLILLGLWIVAAGSTFRTDGVLPGWPVAAAWTLGGVMLVGSLVGMLVSTLIRRPASAFFAKPLYVSIATIGLALMATVVSIGTAMMIAFAFGGLVSMWTRRPAFAFFAAPAYAAVATIGLSVMFATDLYPEYRFHAFWVVPVLVFATWRLTGPWLEGRVDRSFDRRVVAYTALAVGMPAFVVFGHRWATTPDAIPRWRESMAAIELPSLSDTMSPDKRRRLRKALIHSESGVIPVSEPEELLARLDAELASDAPIAGHVVTSDLYSGNQTRLLHAGPSVGPPPGGWPERRRSHEAMTAMLSEIESKQVEVMLRWAGEMRRRGAAGEVPLSFVLAADRLEETAVGRLSDWIDEDAHGIDRETIVRLVKEIPGRSLRRESRRLSLIGDWQRFQDEPWLVSGAINPEKDFARARLTDRMGTRVWLSIERRRTERFVDHLVRHWIEVLDASLRTLDDPARRREIPAPMRERGVIMTEDRAECVRLHAGAIRPWPRHGSRAFAGFGDFVYWTPEFERRIDSLRRRVGR